LTKNCHKLKYEEGVAGDLLNQMKQLKQEKSHSNPHSAGNGMSKYT
jgi:hypothetical protein